MKVSRWLAVFMVVAMAAGVFAPAALAEDPTPTPVPIPEGVKVAGMPEVLPTQEELKAAIPPSLMEMGQGKKLRIMFQGGGDSAPAVEMKDFLKENVGLEIEIDVIPPESLREKQLSVFTAGSSDYDLMELYPTWIGEYAEAGFIENLDPYYEKYAAEINTEDFIAGAQVGFDKYQGSWYAVPYDGDVNIFYYRTDLWEDPAEQAAFKEKYGYDLKYPETWLQVRDMAEFFTRPDEGLWGFGTLALRTWWAADYWANVYRPHIAGDFQNGMVNDQGEFELDREAFIKANDLYMELMKFSPDGILNWGYPESKEALGNGVVAMSMQWATGVFRDPRQASHWDKLGCGLMPGVEQADGSIKHKPALAVGKALVVPTASENKDLAFLLGQFFASKAMQIYETNTGSGVDPNRISVFEDQRVKDVWGPLTSCTMANLDLGVPDIKVPGAAAYYEALIGELHSSWAGEQDSATAYDKVMKQWEIVREEQQ